MNPLLGTIGAVACWRMSQWARKDGHKTAGWAWGVSAGAWAIATLRGAL